MEYVSAFKAIALSAVAVCCVCIGVAALRCADTAIGIRADAKDSAAQLSVQVANLNNTLLATSVAITKQTAQVVAEAHQLNSNAATLVLSANATIQKVGSAVDGLKITQNKVDTLLDSANVVAQSTNAVVASDQIPKLLRDTRRTVALAGNAASHIEGTANAIAGATPKILADADRLVDQSGGVATDVHTATTAFLKPLPWWKKLLSYAGLGITVAGAVK